MKTNSSTHKAMGSGRIAGGAKNYCSSQAAVNVSITAEHIFPPAMNPAVFRGTLLVVVLTMSILSTGCLPIRYVSAHGASGRVVDATTQTPLPEARVALTRPDNSVAKAHTSKEGYFRIPPKHRLYILFPGHSQLFHVPPAATLSVNREGYLPWRRRISVGPFDWGGRERKASDVGQVD